MGLSSSQARLLSLTSRQHDIEYKAQKLEAQKLQMANESNAVYTEYEDALDAQKVQMKTVGNDGSSSYIDATYNNLIAAGYKLSAGSAMIVSQSDLNYFTSTADSSAEEFACLKSGYVQKSGSNIVLSSDNTKNCIFTADQLKAQSASSSGKSYVLMSDLNVTESMGDFSGTLDGNGHTINVSGGDAIFSTLNSATISNLNINANISSGTSIRVAALAGEVNGVTNVSNLNITGSASSSVYYDQEYVTNLMMGSVAACVNSGSSLNISNTSSSMNITATGGSLNADYGGLVGSASGDLNVKDSSYSGNIDVIGNTLSGQTTLGGIVGTMISSSSRINNSYTDGSYYKISGQGRADLGGIVGNTASDGIIISNCASYVDLLALGVNNSQSGTYAVGGILGYGKGTIVSSYTDIGNITATTGLAGSIVGVANGGTSAVNLISNYSNNSESSCGGSTGSSSPNILNPQPESTVLANVPSSGSSGVGATTTENYDPSTASNYDLYLEEGKAMASNTYVVIDGHENDSNWLSNMILGGMLILSKKDSATGTYLDTNVATDTNLQAVSDDKNLKKAEAKYEAAMAKIDAKDKKYDTDIASLDTERTAIKTEIDTLKTVAKDNVDRTFKLFS